MPSLRNGLLLCTIPMLLAQAAQAQSSYSCELLKQTLAARIPPEIRGYSMEDVPAKTPVPAGGKVIGNCEAGARKIIYRRFGGAPLAASGAAPASASASASAPAPGGAPAAAAASTPAPRPAVSALAAPTKPVPSPPPVSTTLPTPKPAPPPAPRTLPAPAAAPVPAPGVAPAKPLVIEKRAEPLPAPRPVEPLAIAVPSPVMPPATQPAKSATTLADDGPGFLDSYGRWLWLLLALPLGALLWAWASHRMAYDSAGLPRGPRL